MQPSVQFTQSVGRLTATPTARDMPPATVPELLATFPHQPDTTAGKLPPPCTDTRNATGNFRHTWNRRRRETDEGCRRDRVGREGGGAPDTRTCLMRTGCDRRQAATHRHGPAAVRSRGFVPSRPIGGESERHPQAQPRPCRLAGAWPAPITGPFPTAPAHFYGICTAKPARPESRLQGGDGLCAAPGRVHPTFPTEPTPTPPESARASRAPFRSRGSGRP